MKRMLHLAFRNARIKLMAPFRRKEMAQSAARDQELFKEVKTFVFFIGYPRSGHSLVGSLLNAHPDVVIAHELDAFRLLEEGASRNELFSKILKRDRKFAMGGQEWAGYGYSVPGGFQGKFEHLYVIGDKKGGRTTRRIADDPGLLDRVRTTVGVPLRIIHIVRNPFDNITTISRKHEYTQEKAIDFYFQLAEAARKVRQASKPGEYLEMHFEDFVQNKDESLRRLFEFLGVSSTPEFRAQCASIVFESPKKSRSQGNWTDEAKRTVLDRAREFDVLARYTFEN